MAVRANKMEPLPTPWVDKLSQRVGMVRARFLPEDLVGPDRLRRLGAPALAEAGHGLSLPVPLVVSLPEAERPDGDDGYDGPILAALSTDSGVALDLDRSVVVRQGHAGMAEALLVGARLLEGGSPAVIVGGLDSYVHPSAARWLDESCRLHGPGTENGITPGEGAAFALLVRGEMAGRQESLRQLVGETATPVAWLRAVGTGRDEQSVTDGAPLLATVMTELVQAAATYLGGHVAWLTSDVNGEYHRVKEWSRIEIRSHPELSECRHDRLSDTMGDVGAAAGALALVVACALWRTGGAPSSSLVVALHSDGAERGVFVLEASDGQ